MCNGSLISPLPIDGSAPRNSGTMHLGSSPNYMRIPTHLHNSVFKAFVINSNRGLASGTHLSYLFTASYMSCFARKEFMLVEQTPSELWTSLFPESCIENINLCKEVMDHNITQLVSCVQLPLLHIQFKALGF